MSLKSLSLVAISLLAFANVSQAEDKGSSIFDSENIKVKGEIRPRYESVDTDNTTNNANALTTRLQLSVESKLFSSDRFSTTFELTDVHAANDNYNSGINGQTAYNIVADPSQTRLTQGYIKYDNGSTTIKAGRQMINIDAQRFVGAVGWRQMPQTFNGYTLTNKSIDKLTLTAGYLTEVNRIFAAGSTQGDSFKTSSGIFHADYKASESLNFSAYAYLIGSKHDTYGLAFKGKQPLGKSMKLDYRVEYAMQSDASMEVDNDGKPTVDAEYYHVKANLINGGFHIGVAQELLGADQENNTSFATPLATLHKFNGWADKFLATPTSGLVDTSAEMGYKSKGFGAFKVIYHNFKSDSGSTHYGDELDLIYKRSIQSYKGLSSMLKYASYKGGDTVASGNSAALATDTQKVWVMLDYKFSNK